MTQELQRLQRRLDRARSAQKQAEDLLERKSRELFALNQELECARDDLEERVSRRTAELERRNAELDVASKEAMAADLAKSEFLANMSHEIRTPLTAILGFAEILEHCLSEAQINGLSPSDSDLASAFDSAQTIRRSGEHLLTIINDILDLSKIEAGRLQLEEIEFRPNEIFDEVMSLMQGRAAEKSLLLNFQVCEDIPALLVGDPTRIRQILVNLVGNAIKFTELGAVTVRATLLQIEHSAVTLVVEVVDTGIGMTAEQCSSVFQPFGQADTSMTRRFGGTGLGLTICRRLAQQMSGDIAVESELGNGSKFRATIQCRVSDRRETLSTNQEAVIDTSTAADTPRRVLLVEDGPDNQKLVSFILRKAGFDVTVKENGELGANAALTEWRKGTPFDAILMDMQMPVMDGYTATSLLREQGYKGTIIALTAHAMREDQQKCLDVGCDDYTTKPVKKKELLSLLYGECPA